jgi:thiol:disulfide interchange protein DsbD
MRKTLLVCLTLLTAATLAQDEDPIRPQEAYRYVVSDTGDAIEVEWAIEDGYYLYRNKLGFEIRATDVTTGEPRLPAGLPHEDEYFGKQEIYRGNFNVSIPYQFTDNRPATLELVIKSQGCWDGGLCYPPQTWTALVDLKPASKPRLQLGNSNAGSLAGLTGKDEFLPVDEAFKPILIPRDSNNIEVTWQIAPDYYLYKDKISVRALSGGVQLGRLELPQGESKIDEFFGESEVYYDEVFAPLSFARATPEAMTLELELGYQGCAEAGLCYPPTTRTVAIDLPAATRITSLADLERPISDQDRKANIITGANIWTVIVSFFGFGLLLAFTPCVLPMIPILTAIIAGEGEDTSPLRGFGLAFSYVMGMAIVYTAAGVIAVAAGAQVQAAFNQPWVLSLFAGLFVLLAVAMFGGYDLQMPASVQGRLAAISNNQKGGTVIGAFIMGALSSLIVTACVAPALVAALAVMSQTGDFVRGGVALFAMSLGMGAPLLLVGAAQGKFLPKVGPWMVAVKSAFGFMMLGLAIWMLSRFLPGSLILGMWGVLAVIVGVFAGGLTSLTHESTTAQKLGKGFGFLAIIYGLLLLLGALTGGSNPMKPLETVSFGSGTAIVEDNHLKFQRIKTVADLDQELDNAAAAGKTAMLDFYADWCVSCIEMEEYTFTDPAVQAALANSVVLQADVTANDEQDKELLARFGVFGPPTIIFFGADGRQLDGYEVVGFMKAEDFLQHLKLAFAP